MFYEKIINVIIQELLYENKKTNFIIQTDTNKKILSKTLAGGIDLTYKATAQEMLFENERSLTYGLLPMNDFKSMGDTTNPWEYFMLSFAKTSLVDPSATLLDKWFASKKTIMHTSNFDGDLSSNIEKNTNYTNDYMLYTDLKGDHFSLPMVVNYSNLLSLILDLKLGKVSKENNPSNWYSRVV